MCREEGFGIKAVLWNTIANNEHRMIHWLQLISIANSQSGGGDYAALERKLNDLQREVRGRSRSPRRQGGNRKPKALPAPSQRLALTDGANKEKSSFRKRNNRNSRKGRGKSSGKAAPSKGFQQLMMAGDEIRKKFHATDNSICFRFQRNICDKGSKCERRHICIGCGGNKPYDACLCLNSQFNRSEVQTPDLFAQRSSLDTSHLLTRYVKPCSAPCRVLLIASGTDLASELWAAMLRICPEHSAGRLFELVYVDTIHLAVFLLTVDFWTTSERACSTWYACSLQQQHGPEYVILTSLDNHRFELVLFRLVYHRWLLPLFRKFAPTT